MNLVMEARLPYGAHLRKLAVQLDARGSLTEVFRQSWGHGSVPVQWNLAMSATGVFRGVHVHIEHDDYLVVTQGRMAIGLRDLRRGSPTEGRAVLLERSGNDLSALVIPHGVAHGFYCIEPSTFLNGVSHYWNPRDDLECHWADPELGISWPFTDALTSTRDASAPTLRELLARLERHQPIGF